MRKITINAVSAFENFKEFKEGNTRVLVDSDSGFATMYLHGHAIAQHQPNGIKSVTHAGWPTMTTKERLNGISGVDVYQKKGVWYLNGNEWRGEWTDV